MPKVTLFKQDGTEAGALELVSSVFGIEPNTHVIQEAILMHNAAQRRGTHSAKTRAEVRGGGIKPWCRIGMGRAMHRSIRSPNWVSGRVAFGPQPARNYKYKFSKRVRLLAFRSALSIKVQEDSFIVLDELNFDAPKTTNVVSMLDA